MIGKIITFYSYKGGTGRTMALANIAWILASNNKKVLVIDWDLEAPGLHRYFSPFLIDYDCSSTDGLIDLFYDYANAAHTPQIQGGENDKWSEPYLDINRYAVSLNTVSLKPPLSVLNFVSSGRQGANYAVRMNSFDWHNFYERLGGGTFLDKLKNNLIEEYDYILIDSRTGVSDTAGICTVQLPDIILPCFTLNNQSLDGASAVIESVLQQRKNNQPEIYPIPMRVELGEKDKLEKMRNKARTKFDPISSKKIKDLDDYWKKVEVLYQPYYAYEEILATFADTPNQPNTLLSSMEKIVSFITNGEITELIGPNQQERLQILEDLLSSRPPFNTLKTRFDVFLSHNGKDKPAVEILANKLEAKGLKIWLDKWNLIPGESWQEGLIEALDHCQTYAVFVGPSGIGPWENEEMRVAIEERARDKKHRVIPVLLPGAPDNTSLKLPRFLTRLTWVDFRSGINDEDTLYRLECGIKGVAPKPLTKSETTTPTSDNTPPSVGDLPLGSYLPFSPNPLFTGRIEDLRKLADALVNHVTTGTVITQAITGMGGLGKTQLAVEFAYRYGNQFQGVHWLNLADPTTLDSEIASCGQKMGLEDWPDDQPSQVAITERAWKERGPCLLILDNFEDVADANNILPRFRHSSIRILVTSRRSDWLPTTGLNPILLELFSPKESLDFLKRSLLKRKDNDDELNTLAERLGHLPLALELASRYLNGHTRLSVTEYLEQTKESLEHASMNAWKKDVLGLTPTQHDTSLYSTFALSWLELKDETAQKMFQSAGYLAPNTAIPLEIFEKTLEITSEHCDEALTLLYGLGLLRESESQTTIHPLLAEYARGVSQKNVKILEALANTLAILSKEAVDTGLPARFDSIKAHIPVLALFAENEKIKSASTLWNNCGYHLNMIADYSGARAAYERALIIDPDDAAYINNLGSVMQSQGDLVGARAAFERALKIDEATFGTDHPNVSRDVNNLGDVMLAQGDLVGARTAIERAIKIAETNFETEAPQVAIAVNNLGMVMKEQGDLVGARAAFERALKIDEVYFGSDHPNVARNINNLGMVMKEQGDLVGARAAYERALKIDEAAFGTDHPNVARNINNLGMVMQAQGNLVGARVAFERAIKIWETNLGVEHPQVAIVVNNLGMVMKAQGDLVGAYAAYERALAILKKFLPPDHPNIKTVQGNLDILNNSKT